MEAIISRLDCPSCCLSWRLHRAGLAVESLEAGVVGWQILDPSRHEVSETIRDIFKALKLLKMEFTMCQYYKRQQSNGDPVHFKMEDDQCQIYLEEDKHVELLRSTTLLEELDLFFIPVMLRYWDLELEFKIVHWPYLLVLSLKCYQGIDDDLLQLFRRHSTTLRILELSHYRLTKGLWLYTLRKMRTTLRLERFRLVGNL